MIHILIKGIIIGLITGFPLGPVGAYCLKTTLKNGALFGLVCGLGSSVVDAIYASIAALGITLISTFFGRYQCPIRIIGGIILMIFGIHIMLSKKENEQEQQISCSKTLAKSLLATCMIAIANPGAIFSFLVVFATYGSRNIGHGVVARTILIIGVFCGSYLWWILIVLATKRFHKHLNPKKNFIINIAIGATIVCFGILFIITANHTRYIRPSFMHSKFFKTVLHFIR